MFFITSGIVFKLVDIRENVTPYTPLCIHLNEWINSCATIILSCKHLPKTNLTWLETLSSRRITRKLFAVVLVINLYDSLQRLIGLNWWTNFGCCTLGIKTRNDLFESFTKSLLSTTSEAYWHIFSLTTDQLAWKKWARGHFFQCPQNFSFRNW